MIRPARITETAYRRLCEVRRDFLAMTDDERLAFVEAVRARRIKPPQPLKPPKAPKPPKPPRAAKPKPPKKAPADAPPSA